MSPGKQGLIQALIKLPPFTYISFVKVRVKGEDSGAQNPNSLKINMLTKVRVPMKLHQIWLAPLIGDSCRGQKR